MIITVAAYTHHRFWADACYDWTTDGCVVSAINLVCQRCVWNVVKQVKQIKMAQSPTNRSEQLNRTLSIDKSMALYYSVIWGSIACGFFSLLCQPSTWKSHSSRCSFIKKKKPESRNLGKLCLFFCRSFCMEFHFNFTDKYLLLFCKWTISPVCALQSEKPLDHRDETSYKQQKKRVNKNTTEMCVSPTNDANEFLPDFFFRCFSLVALSRQWMRFLSFRNCFTVFFFHSSLLLFFGTFRLLNIITLVNSNADKKSSARYEPWQCYVRRFHWDCVDGCAALKNGIGQSARVERIITNENIVKTKWR